MRQLAAMLLVVGVLGTAEETLSEFVFETAPFASAHASTIVDTTIRACDRVVRRHARRGA